MKLHRAATLLVMMAISLLFIGAMTYDAVRTWSGQSLVALAVVVASAAVAGVAFSWKRYFGR